MVVVSLAPEHYFVELHEFRFMHFLALAPDVDKTASRRSDLGTVLLCFQKLTEWIPGIPLLVFSGVLQEIRFGNFLALCPQKSKERLPGVTIQTFSCSRFRSPEN